MQNKIENANKYYGIYNYLTNKINYLQNKNVIEDLMETQYRFRN